MEENKITHDIIWKQLLLFFFPILFGSVFQQLYGLADTIIIGQFVGKEALAAIGGSATRIADLMVGVFVGLSSGASVILAQYYGANNKRKVELTVHTSIAFCIVSALLITVVGVTFSKQLLILLKTPIDTLDDAHLYLSIYLCGTLFNLLYNMVSALLRAVGDSKRPLYVLIFTCFSNVILDIICIVVFHLGIVGAAIATITCQAMSAIIVLSMLIHTKDIYKLELKKVKIHFKYLKRILNIGIPAAVESLGYSITNSFIQIYINILGTNTIAAWATAGKVDAFFWMFMSAFGISITTFVAQNYGANQIARMRKSVKVCMLLEMLFCTSVAGILLFNLEFFYRLFTSDLEVIRIGLQVEYYLMPTYLLFIVINILSGALRGVGKVLVPMILSCGGVCTIRILWLLYAFDKTPTLNTIMFSYPLSYVLTGVCFIIYYFYTFPREQ